MKTSILTTLVLGLISIPAMAGIGKIPANLTQLSGAFTGQMKNSGTNVKAIIVPKTEKPGTFLVALLIGDPQGILLEGELIAGTKTIGLSSLGLSADRSEMEVTIPPAALMNVVSRNGDTQIEIVPQAGRGVVSETVVLDCKDDDISIGLPTPGEYNEGKWFSSAQDRVEIGADGIIKAEISNSKMKLNGQYLATQDRGYVSTLRALSFDGNYQTQESEQISAWILGVTDGRKNQIWVAIPTPDGQATEVIVLKKK